MTDRLGQLLRDADAAVAVPPAQADLPNQLRRRQVRRTHRMRIVQTATAGAAAVAIICLLLPALHDHRPSQGTESGNVAIAPTPVPPSPRAPGPQSPTPAGARALANESELAALDLTARLHERIADDLLANAAARRHRASVPAHDPTLGMLQQQRDRAALLLVYQADQFRKQNQPQQAAAAYQRAIDLFPQSHWAGVARERLKGNT